MGDEVHIERRPSGNQVISARLPDSLALPLLDEASRLQVSPSEMVRRAVEAYLRPLQPALTASVSGNMRIGEMPGQYRTENDNLVVEPPEMVLTCAGCPHGRPSWHSCPWCLGINGDGED